MPGRWPPVHAPPALRRTAEGGAVLSLPMTCCVTSENLTAVSVPCPSLALYVPTWEERWIWGCSERGRCLPTVTPLSEGKLLVQGSLPGEERKGEAQSLFPRVARGKTKATLLTPSQSSFPDGLRSLPSPLWAFSVIIIHSIYVNSVIRVRILTELQLCARPCVECWGHGNDGGRVAQPSWCSQRIL